MKQTDGENAVGLFFFGTEISNSSLDGRDSTEEEEEREREDSELYVVVEEEEEGEEFAAKCATSANEAEIRRGNERVRFSSL